MRYLIRLSRQRRRTLAPLYACCPRTARFKAVNIFLIDWGWVELAKESKPGMRAPEISVLLRSNRPIWNSKYIHNLFAKKPEVPANTADWRGAMFVLPLAPCVSQFCLNIDADGSVAVLTITTRATKLQRLLQRLTLICGSRKLVLDNDSHFRQSQSVTTFSKRLQL